MCAVIDAGLLFAATHSMDIISLFLSLSLPLSISQWFILQLKNFNEFMNNKTVRKSIGRT